MDEDTTALYSIRFCLSLSGSIQEPVTSSIQRHLGLRLRLVASLRRSCRIAVHTLSALAMRPKNAVLVAASKVWRWRCWHVRTRFQCIVNGHYWILHAIHCKMDIYAYFYSVVLSIGIDSDHESRTRAALQCTSVTVWRYHRCLSKVKSLSPLHVVASIAVTSRRVDVIAAAAADVMMIVIIADVTLTSSHRDIVMMCINRASSTPAAAAGAVNQTGLW